MLDIRNIDCMELMKQYEDNYFDLAIVDPPYGLGKKLKPRGGMIGKYGSFEGMGEHSWDNKPPTQEYFDELRRVSKEQIIWGGNYFIENLKNTQCFLVWDKQNGGNPMADCELAWTSFKNKVARLYSGHIFKGIGCTNYHSIHPTQKPVLLYNWILDRFAEKGMKILDTHLGSGSIAISCHYAGLALTACEIDKDYYEKALKRIAEETAQTELLFNH